MTRHDVHKIAIVVPKYGLVGGAEHVVSELTERIALNSKYEIHVFANKWRQLSDLITFHKVPVIAFPKFLTSISFAYFARKKIADTEIDLIHAHDRIFDADIFTMHGIPHRMWVEEVREKRMSLFDYGTAWVERCLVENKRCKKFIAVSTLTKEKFLKQYSTVNPERVAVIHPGIDTSRIRSLDRLSCRREIMQRYHIDSTDKIILFVSMNFDIKGLDFLIKALSRLKTRYPSERFKLLVVGKGNEKKYGMIAENLGIRDRVIFTGIMPREHLERIYVASDIFSMLSRFDTFGMAALEAMAASLPVIISSNVGAKDLIRQGVNGYVTDSKDSTDEIADKIRSMLEGEVQTRMARNAFNTAATHTWDDVTGKVEDIYEDLLKSLDT
ncbi:MAG: glycosyltransferase family 4 protein [Syntrophales bacterium]